MQEAYESGLSTYMVAEKFETTQKTVWRHLKAIGVIMRSPGNRQPGRAEEIRKMRNDGMTYAQIGEKFGITRQTAHAFLHRRKGLR